VADGGGLENRCGVDASPWVRIPHPPLTCTNARLDSVAASGCISATAPSRTKVEHSYMIRAPMFPLKDAATTADSGPHGLTPSLDCDRFDGRRPQRLTLADPDVALRPRLVSDLVKNEGVSNAELVTAVDLDQWSGSLNAQSTLPVLVRRLVLATASVTEIAMRGREGTLLPGWDGLVKATAEDPHVPTGTSAWEMGTSNDPRAKAQSDYKARTDNPLGVDPTTTTFLAVTSRIWRDRDDWRAARRSEGQWADVRAYDADDLETWLERAPSVHIWISELLGREPRDVRTPDRWWATWSSQTHPILPRAFLLAGRSTASDLTEALAQSSQVITVNAPSKEEALAVICAVLADEINDVDRLAARSVVVSGAGAWDRLADSDASLVLIPTFEDPDVATALSRGHRVVVPASRVVRSRGVEVKVGPLDQLKATEALTQAAGLGRETSDKYAAHARRNLLSLRRTIAVSPAFKRPSWSQAAEGSRLMPLLLAGAWRQDSDGDREAIATLAGRPYTDIETDIASWSVLEDAPLRRSGQTWSVVSKSLLIKGPGQGGPCAAVLIWLPGGVVP
jgi:hypothetical protein